MTTPKAQPSILLEAGFQIGYGPVLAELAETIELRSGTHYLLARNGRGKTTLLRSLARTLKPLNGKSEVKGRVQYLPEDLRFDEELVVKSLIGAMVPKAKRVAALEMAERIELDVKKSYGHLSTGNRRKVSLIVSEYSVSEDEGNLLLLDEPFSGLDVFARQAFETLWAGTGENVLRLVSCHPDYDRMPMESVLLIEGGKIRHLQQQGQVWSDIKPLMK